MYELTVRASEKYKITITEGLGLFRARVLPLVKGESVAIVTDDRVNGLYGDALNGFLGGKRVIKIVMKSGEKSKNARNYLRIINALAENGFTREDTVIAFGGGVVGDVAGFAASTYMRGITLISVPTTLLAAVDSSVGGKTAIDLDCGKNLCGTFYQPSAVYINTEFLKTLPVKEIKNGLGEVIKYAFLSDTVTASDVKNAGGDLIYRCLKIKRDIVERDEKEKGERALLNLGHTFGHAIEKLSGYKSAHGACVIKGLVYTIEISKRLYGLSDKTVSEMYGLLKSGKHDLSCPFSAESLIAQITADKKRKGDGINFVALKGIGKPEITEIKISDLEKMAKSYESEISAF
ncbi:MAG: 3-dehydroquinate synthase [Clostridia bacterium]|nr:3-dehydroquinate synthase [Clostridia bacterium]